MRRTLKTYSKGAPFYIASHAMGNGDEFHVGPHIMITGLDQKTMQTMNRDGSNGEPYVNNLPGHSELYLVIPIREWEDAQSGMK